MNKEELLKAVSNIDDKYIHDAEQRRDNINPRNSATFSMVQSNAKTLVESANKKTAKVHAGYGRQDGRKLFAKPWFKGACAAVAAFIILIGIGSSGWLLRGIGAAKSDAATEAEFSYQVGAADYYDNGAKEEAAYDMEMRTTNSVVEMSQEKMKDMQSGLSETYEPMREQKLVYNAFLYLQTENYNESFTALEKLVADLDGYFESQSVSNGNYYSNSSKSGYCVVRIPTANYETFMNAIGQSWHVVNKDESVSDISQQYYETQDRLDTLKIKEERLHSLLAEATNLSDIIVLEEQLTETEYQIEQFTNAMKGYDKQVDYSTVNISLDEVTQMGNTVGSEGFGKRFTRAIKNGLRNFAEGVADFIVWIGYNVIEIIITAAVIFVIWKFHLIRKLVQWIKR